MNIIVFFFVIIISLNVGILLEGDKEGKFERHTCRLYGKIPFTFVFTHSTGKFFFSVE